LVSGGADEEELASRGISAHRVYTVEVRHAVEVTAAEEAHLTSWLSKRLDHQLKAPDLTSAGFRLVGGRMLPNNGKPAAQFMYEDGSGRRLTLYVARCQPNRVTAFRYERQDGVGAFYWMDGSIGYAVIGDGEREALHTVASAVYDQVDR
jgi:anti-sigma factor RsiW